MNGSNGSSIGQLKKRPDFVAAASGRRFHTERMSVQGRIRTPGENETITGLRYGLTVTKRVGHATERNRIKRRLRNAVAEAATGHEKLNMDMVIIGRRGILSADYALLVTEINEALRIVSKPGKTKSPRSGHS